MAWDIILKSLGIILAIMVVAQAIFHFFGDKRRPGVIDE